MTLNIVPIPAFHDNYIWCLVNEKNKQCAIVDPGKADPVLDYLATEHLELAAVLITHHHWDHTGGISALLQKHPAPVFAPKNEKVSDCDHPVSEKNVVSLPKLDITFKVIEIPGHTSGHIAYFGGSVLFCGDTLFTGGCGRVFEGTPKQMLASLKKLCSLPDDTLVYCGHEYTQANLIFALVVEPNNKDLKNRKTEVDLNREQNLPTVPSTLEIEKKTNPFLRCHLNTVIDAAESHIGKKLHTPEEVFAVIRTWKNEF